MDVLSFARKHIRKLSSSSFIGFVYFSLPLPSIGISPVDVTFIGYTAEYQVFQTADFVVLVKPDPTGT
jgi:hypothetical protein